MKTHQLTLLIGFILSSFFVKGQLSGTAFLSGQTNHSGIKVKFIAQSGMAVTDSAVTNSSGNYSINIASGVYSVALSSPGYISTPYNAGAAVLLTNAVTLSSMTLSPGNAVFVSGNVSGNWTSNNTYLVTGDVAVPAGTVLTIQPGTTIKFNGLYAFNVSGILLAAGTAANPIRFTSNQVPAGRGNWYRLRVSTSASIIDHCIIEYNSEGLNADGASPTISNSVFRHISTIALSVYNSSSQVINNEIYDVVNTQGNAAIGINAANSNGTGPLIECNRVYSVSTAGWNAYGMRVWENGIARNNEVHDVSGYTARGIDVGPSRARVENNHIYNCGSGIQFYYQTVAPEPVIVNNTIHSNVNGIYFAGATATTRVSNNIIVNNQKGIYQPSGVPPDISYNLVWNNSTANYQVGLVGVGQMVGNNTWGSPIDPYYNLSQDPLFALGTPPVLSLVSPCINAGNPVYSPHIGIQNSAACEKSGPDPTSIFSSGLLNGAIRIFPNPAQDLLHVETELNGEYTLYIFDINGRLLLEENFNGGTVINVAGLSAGVYNLTVRAGNNLSAKKLVIVK
jgi:hypothetical protein